MLRHLHATSDELFHIDLLRLGASCGIISLHFAHFLSPETRALLGPIGGLTIFVDLFFVVSGFIIAYRYAGQIDSWGAYANFLRRRIARLGPLHWATFLFFLGIGAMVWSGRMGSDHAEFSDPRCILPNFLAVHAWGFCDNLTFNDVSWSISAEMGMYLIAPALLFIAARAPIALAVLAVLVIALLSLAPTQSWLEWTWRFGVIRALPSFALGMVLSYQRGTIARLPTPRLVGAAAFALLLVGIHLDWARLILLPVVYLIVVAIIAADMSDRCRPLRIGALGQLTYSLYMIHPIVRTVFLSFVGHRVLHVSGPAADVMVAIGFVLTFVLSYLSLVYFETPMRRLLSRPWQPAPANSIGIYSS